jgi:hypothetical protein
MSISRRSVLPVYAFGVVMGGLFGHLLTREASTSVQAQAQVAVYDRQASYFYVERFKTKRGHEMSISHSRTDGGCRMFLYATIDGVSIDVLQQVDVRFCQVLQQLPADAVKKVKP